MDGILDVDKPPRVIYQQTLICNSCLCEHTHQELVGMIKDENGTWKTPNKTYYATNICACCHNVLEKKTSGVILWPMMAPKDKQDERSRRLRDPECCHMIGEDRFWIYWSDGLKMAQNTMIKDKYSRDWWKGYWCYIDKFVEQEAVVL